MMIIDLTLCPARTDQLRSCLEPNDLFHIDFDLHDDDIHLRPSAPQGVRRDRSDSASERDSRIPSKS